jgi:superfamily II RNA helicase
MESMIYDPFQQEAIDYINQGISVIVSAPTGAGKTAIAEHVIRSCTDKCQGVIYAAPIKALSNQKFRDFQGQFGEDIGILTGDVSLNSTAPVLIMTTEIFRNKVLDEPESLNKYKWIIYDEIHYLDNYERGTVWEESLMFLPKHMNLLGLSATIPNIKEVATWIECIHAKPIKIVLEEKRPVPLHFFYQCGNQIDDQIPRPKKLIYAKTNKLGSLVHWIRQNNGFPCIYFVFGRKKAEELACMIANENFLKPEEQEQIMAMYAQLCERYNLKNEKSASLLYPLVRNGIAYHHAGMLPTLKEVIEQLFTSRLIKLIFTTETFALGINMPSRSVIFDGLSKYYGRFIRILKTRDFYQMAGRAGRRGMDKEGFVYCRVNLRNIKPEEVKQVIYSKPEPVRSQFNTSYATILNLYQKYQDNLANVYALSLHYYQSRRNQQKQATDLMEAKLKLLKDMKYIDNGALTHKGEFAKAVYGYELLLSELYNLGAFEQLDEVGLGILAVSCVFEPRKNQTMLTISKPTRKIKIICEEVYAGIKEREHKLRIFPQSKLPYFNLAHALEYWLQGTEFAKILQHTDTDEGEVVRYFRMAIQILREIRESAVCSQVLKERITETIRVMNRDVVDAEKQLRES